jgi:hypothetical protein
MPRLDFYNVNANRSYPLVNRNSYPFTSGAGTVELPVSVLLDAGFMFGIAADLNAEEPVYLRSIVRSSGALTFIFETSGLEYRFQRSATSGFGTTGYELAFGGAHDDGEGFLVTGELADFHAALSGGVIWAADDDYQIEPALIQTLKDSYMLNMSLAVVPNEPGDVPEFCQGSSSLGPKDPVVVARDLTGDLIFKPGYNCRIDVIERGNEIKFSAVKGDGYGETCVEIDPDDTSSEAAQLDGVTCRDVMATINGVAPTSTGTFVLTASSPGVIITNIADEHKIIIDFSLEGLDGAWCLDDE